MLHAALQILWFVAVLYSTVSVARNLRWRAWVLGFWAADTLISFACGDRLWPTVFAAANLIAAHFAPLIDLALIRWADRAWQELNRRP